MRLLLRLSLPASAVMFPRAECLAESAGNHRKDARSQRRAKVVCNHPDFASRSVGASRKLVQSGAEGGAKTRKGHVQ